VFLGLYGATPRGRNFATIWKRAKAAAGVSADLHFHDLRHAGNHFAAASGASTRELMGRMEHASMGAALICQHRTFDLLASCSGLLRHEAATTRSPSHCPRTMRRDKTAGEGDWRGQWYPNLLFL